MALSLSSSLEAFSTLLFHRKLLVSKSQCQTFKNKSADFDMLRTAGINNTVGSYSWTIPTVLPQYSYYDLEILLDSNPNMFSQADAEFVISGLNPTTTSSATSATQTSQTTSEPPSSTASTSTTSGDLTIGAKIGIGVGAGVVGVLLLILLSLFMFRRGKRAIQKEQSQTTAGEDKTDPPLKDVKVAEMESTTPMRELQGSTVFAELEAGSRSGVVRKPLPGMQETNQKFRT
jgi:hypothetical protein